MVNIERAVLYHTVIRVPNDDEIKAWDNFAKENYNITSNCASCKYCKNSNCTLKALSLNDTPKMCRKNHRIFSLDVYNKKGKKLFPCEYSPDAHVHSIDYDVISRVRIRDEFWSRYRVIVRLEQ